MDYDPDLLRAFIAVRETGGFTRAGERLHLSQSAISHQIRRLEAQAGTSLLTRTTRSLTLTEDGEDFLRHAEHILRAQDAMARRFQRSPVAGNVRFGIPENYLGDRLPSLLTKFSRMFPAVRLDVTVDNYLALAGQVAADALDLAVTLSLDNGAQGGAGTALRQTRFVWAAAETFEIPPDSPLPVAFAPAPCLHRQIGIGALDHAGLPWRMAFTSPSQQGLRAAVQAGLAVTALPQEDLETGMVVLDHRHERPVLPALPTASFRLLWGASVKTAAAEELARLLTDLPEKS